jgi:hypothetical protein
MFESIQPAARIPLNSIMNRIVPPRTNVLKALNSIQARTYHTRFGSCFGCLNEGDSICASAIWAVIDLYQALRKKHQVACLPGLKGCKPEDQLDSCLAELTEGGAGQIGPLSRMGLPPSMWFKVDTSGVFFGRRRFRLSFFRYNRKTNPPRDSFRKVSTFLRNCHAY